MKHKFSINVEKAFSEENLLNAYTHVEGQMSLEQSKVGIIPRSAGKKIYKNATFENLNKARLKREFKKNNNLILSLTNELADICGEAGKYVHWGGTSKNITDTGQLLILRETHRKTLSNLANLLHDLKQLASKNNSTLMIGRTMGQYALPITFGFKVAGWLQGLIRCEERFKAAEKVVFTLHFGGAVGGHHGFQGKGILLSKKLAASFGFLNSTIPNRISVDKYADYILASAFLANTIKHITKEIYLLMSQDIGELSELQSKDLISSSTMPQKTNPILPPPILSDCSILISQATSVLTSDPPLNEGDDQYNLLIDKVLRNSVDELNKIINKFNILIISIKANKKVMEENLISQKDALLLEKLMLELGNSIGRAKAHDHLNKISNKAKKESIPIYSLLSGDDLIKQHFKNKKLKTFLEPKHYVGECETLTKNIVKDTSLRVLEIRKRISRKNLAIK
mgnify:CR=1 FL=1